MAYDIAYGRCRRGGAWGRPGREALGPPELLGHVRVRGPAPRRGMGVRVVVLVGGWEAGIYIYIYTYINIHIYRERYT